MECDGFPQETRRDNQNHPAGRGRLNWCRRQAGDPSSIPDDLPEKRMRSGNQFPAKRAARSLDKRDDRINAVDDRELATHREAIVGQRRWSGEAAGSGIDQVGSPGVEIISTHCELGSGAKCLRLDECTLTGKDRRIAPRHPS